LYQGKETKGALNFSLSMLIMSGLTKNLTTGV